LDIAWNLGKPSAHGKDIRYESQIFIPFKQFMHGGAKTDLKNRSAKRAIDFQSFANFNRDSDFFMANRTGNDFFS